MNRSDVTDGSRLAYVDGLRAVAVLGVVVHHAATYQVNFTGEGLVNQILRQGCHGVELFFVISGFCLSYPLLAKLRERGVATFDIATFAARRLVRIAPPYYVALLSLFVVAVILEHAHVVCSIAIAPGSTSLTELMRQAAFLDYDTKFVNTSFWSLPVELRWYVMFPIALWLWVRSPRAFGVVALAALLASLTRAGSLDLLVLPAFMLGIVAAQIHLEGRRYARFAVPVCIAFSVLLLFRTPPGRLGFVSPAAEIAVFAFFITGGEIPALTRLLSTKALTFIGGASYSIYLIHGPLIGVAEQFGMWPVAAGIFGVAAGLGFWWLAERPFVEGPLRDMLVAKFTFMRSSLRSLHFEIAEAS
jgi:peptidoglycan/LPS O-acetylase OafA/YrhL